MVSFRKNSWWIMLGIPDSSQVNIVPPLLCIYQLYLSLRVYAVIEVNKIIWYFKLSDGSSILSIPSYYHTSQLANIVDKSSTSQTRDNFLQWKVIYKEKSPILIKKSLFECLNSVKKLKDHMKCFKTKCFFFCKMN